MSEDSSNNKSENTSPSSSTQKSKSRGEYKVVFRGNLIDGFSKADVIANVARLTKIDKEKIEKKFFSGKAVIIRRAHDQAHAQKLQQLFTKAGLEVMILKDARKSEAQVETSNSEEKAKKVIEKEIKKTLKTVKNRRRPIMIVALGVVFISILIYLWNQFNISVETPKPVLKIEQALANESLIFLSHINVERILSLHDYFVDDPNALPGTQSTLYNKLKKSGIDPQNTIQQVVIASYIKNKQAITHNILLGNFPVKAVKQFLLNHYYGELIPETGFIRVKIAELDPVSCEKSHFKEVAIEPNRILIATDGHLDELIELLDKEQGNATDLTHWAAYRNDKLLSMALFKPDEGTKLTSGMNRMIASGLIQKNKSVDSLFAGVGMQLIPPSGLVGISLNSSDDAWLKKTYSQIETQLKKMKGDTQGLDSLQVLLDKISVSENNDQLLVELQLDGDLKQSIETSIKELAAQMMSFGPPASEQLASAKVTEKINAQATQYLPELQSSQLGAFNVQLDQLFKPAWVDGPFAVAVDELLMEKNQIVFQLRAKGQNIANMGNHQAKLNIVAVQDKNGVNVLEQEKCGRPIEQKDAFFGSWGGIKTSYVNNQPVKYSEIEAKQKVKVKPDVQFSQLQSVQAEVELHLAKKTQTEIFAKPEKNKVLSAYDSRLFFKPSSGNTLSYTISGDEKRILAVRALNQKKQYLSSASRSSMDNLWGSGRSVSQDFQGNIAFIEVVYATEFEKITYPVSINKFPPYYSDNNWRYDPAPIKIISADEWDERYHDLSALDIIQENNWQGKQQAKWHKGPFNLALFGLKYSKHWGTRGQLTIKTPVIDELQNNLSVLEIFLEYPQKADNGDMGQSWFYQLKPKGYYMNGEFVADQNKPYMAGQLSFNLPASKSKSMPDEIKGEIIVHLPIAKNRSTHRNLTIGSVWEDVGVAVKIVRLANNVIEFDVSGNRERLLQITLLDHENRRISTSDIKQGFGSALQGGNIVVNYHGIPEKAQLTVAEGQQIRRYPFNLIPE